MIETAIRSILINDAAVSAITTRCYPVMIPQAPTYPLMLYTKVSGTHDHSLSGPTGLRRTRMQIEAWDKTLDEANVLARAICGALDGYIGTVAGVKIGSCLVGLAPHPIIEPELGVHRVVQDYMIYHKED